VVDAYAIVKQAWKKRYNNAKRGRTGYKWRISYNKRVVD